MNYHMRRTTLVIDDQRLVDLKRLAAARRQTLSSLVDEFLREGLHKEASVRAKPAKLVLPTRHMGRPRVDVADRDKLYDFMEGR
jgi:hypothetical protein